VPDSWGRPTFNDGMQIAVGINYLQNSKAKREAFEADAAWTAERRSKLNADEFLNKEAAIVAVQMNKGEPLPEDLDPRVEFMAADLARKEKIAELSLKNQQTMATTEGIKQESALFQNMEMKRKVYFDEYRSKLAAGDKPGAAEMAAKWVNAGINGMQVTNISEDGTQGEGVDFDFNAHQQAIDFDQVTEQMSSYYALIPEDRIKAFAGGRQQERERNAELAASGPMFKDPKSGKIAILVRGGWKNGQRIPAYFVDQKGNEIPFEEGMKYETLAGDANPELSIKLRKQALDESKFLLDVIKASKEKPESISDELVRADYELGEKKPTVSPKQKKLGDAAVDTLAKGMGIKFEKEAETETEATDTLTPEMLAKYLKEHPDKFPNEKAVIEAAKKRGWKISPELEKK
jgi:hypothetical protein